MVCPQTTVREADSVYQFKNLMRSLVAKVVEDGKVSRNIVLRIVICDFMRIDILSYDCNVMTPKE